MGDPPEFGLHRGAESLDKVRAITPVATAASDERFTAIARAGSAAQVQRICATYRNVEQDDSPEALERRR